jgi:hypothetical protein
MTHRRSRPKKTPPQIFAPGGESLQFYIYPLTEQKQTIQKLIEDHGGKVERRKTEGVIALGDMHSVSQAATSSVFSIDFVHDSIEAGHLKDLNLYRLSETVLDHDSLSLPVRRSKRSFSDANLSSSQPVKRKRLPFTEEDDVRRLYLIFFLFQT